VGRLDVDRSDGTDTLKVSLDKDPMVVLEIRAGLVELTDAEVILISSQDDVLYHLHEATCKETRKSQRTQVNQGGDHAEIESSRELVSLGHVAAGSTIRLVIPYVGNSATDLAKVSPVDPCFADGQARSVLRYRTDSGEVRQVFDRHAISMSLPLTVNVQDFFRPQQSASFLDVPCGTTDSAAWSRTLRLHPMVESEYGSAQSSSSSQSRLAMSSSQHANRGIS
jgi:hypothetical protein